MAIKFTVDGIAMYASVHTINIKAKKFTVDLVVSDETKEKLLATGIPQAKDATRKDKSYADQGFPGAVFTFKRNPKIGNPIVADSQGNHITNLVGNGSKVRIHGSPFAWTYDGKSGVSGSFDAVQVIELVEFNNKLDKIEGGFVAKAEDKINAVPPVEDKDQGHI